MRTRTVQSEEKRKKKKGKEVKNIEMPPNQTKGTIQTQNPKYNYTKKGVTIDRIT